MRVRMTPRARSSLMEIADYLRVEAGKDVAKRVVRRIRDEVEKVGRMPGIGHMREDLASDAVRFRGVYSYLIVYRPDTNPVEVLDIIHGARDVAAVLRDRGIR